MYKNAYTFRTNSDQTVYFPSGHKGRHFPDPFSSKKNNADLWPIECDRLKLGQFQ